jgi:hypothetical protein
MEDDKLYEVIVLYKNGRERVYRTNIKDKELINYKINIQGSYTDGLHCYIMFDDTIINIFETVEIKFKKI